MRLITSALNISASAHGDHGSSSTREGQTARRGTSVLQHEILDSLHDDNQDGDHSGGWKMFLLSGVLLFTFVAIQANENVVKTASKVKVPGEKSLQFGYDPGSVVVAVTFISGILANFVAFLHRGVEGLKNCWDWRFMVRMAPGSMLFTVGQILKFVALKYLATDIMVLMDQGQLVLLAIFSRIFLGRHYSLAQWCLLANIMFLMMLYMRLRTEESMGESKGLLVGASVMFVCILVSVAGSLFMEYLLKGGGDEKVRSYWEQKALMAVPDFTVSVIWMVAVSPFIPGIGNPDKSVANFFAGWTSVTWLVAFMMMVKLWLSGLIAKVLDSVIRQLGSSMGVLMIYVEELILPPPFGHPDSKFKFDTFVGLIGVLMTMGAFSLDAGQQKMHQKIEANYEKKIEHTTQLVEQLIEAKESGAKEDASDSVKPLSD